MTVFGESLPIAVAILLFLALGLALAFEFANGFHDTANAVATVIYTHTLRPVTAVVWSGVWNFLGVLTSSGIVAFGILAPLPVELVLNVGSTAGLAMVLALLLAAMIWTVGTWYYGIPASSSHTRIGSILGVGMANAVLVDREPFGAGVNWSKATEVFSSLLISPVFGFGLAAALFLLCKWLVRNPPLYLAPQGRLPPPLWIGAILIFTCTGVSFAHGSNDGQKGMGLILMILIGMLPGAFALNSELDEAELQSLIDAADLLTGHLNGRGTPRLLIQEEAVDEISRFVKQRGVYTERTGAAIARTAADLRQSLRGKRSLGTCPRRSAAVCAVRCIYSMRLLRNWRKRAGCRPGRTRRPCFPSKSAWTPPPVTSQLGSRWRSRWLWAWAPWSAGNASLSRWARRSAKTT